MGNITCLVRPDDVFADLSFSNLSGMTPDNGYVSLEVASTLTPRMQTAIDLLRAADLEKRVSHWRAHIHNVGVRYLWGGSNNGDDDYFLYESFVKEQGDG